ncbi:alkyl sulfatase dimerization domain-containing protein [Maribellus mangrovi]|uniref:alkyl sulfatase dimerization domain-containing protein n=1 Tax=Maribellus mangrovi TaxID=3133146 RepID=UPI0030EFA2F9
MKSKSVFLLIMVIITFYGYSQEKSRYMGGNVELVEAPNGAIVNKKVLETAPKITYLEPTTEKLADGVWCIGGYSLANSTVIEGDDGLIVYDAGDTKEEAEHIRTAIEKVSSKPIKVIIYSHSHYALGAGALVDNPDDVMVIGHPKLNETVESSLKGGGSPSAIPEVGPLMTSRLLIQFNNFMPVEGPDAALAGKLEVGKPIAFIPANKTVSDGEELEVLGVKLQFFTKYTSDDYNLTVYVPEKGLVMNNFFWPGTPNIYTLRGGVYRDPLIWRDGLKVIRDLQPEILSNTHTRAITGKEEVARRLTGYMDQLTLTYDQTLRGILGGLGPDELRHAIYIPEHMKNIPENAQTYGETVHFPEAIYQYVIGWFDGDVTKLFAIPPTEEAERMVKLIGGQEKVIAEAKQALENNEFAWGAQIIQYAYLLEPTNTEIRSIKAELLRQMGYRTTGSIARAFLLTEALALEGKVNYPKLIPPSAEIIASSPTTFVDYYRVRIDPKKSEETDKVIEFEFTDKGNQSVALHIRKGVVEFIPTPADYYKKTDFTLKLDALTWAALYLNSVTLEEAIKKGKVVIDGDNKVLVSIWNMFDVFEPAKNYTIPPLED